MYDQHHKLSRPVLFFEGKGIYCFVVSPKSSSHLCPVSTIKEDNVGSEISKICISLQLFVRTFKHLSVRRRGSLSARETPQIHYQDGYQSLLIFG
jgi:hypothetical protein